VQCNHVPAKLNGLELILVARVAAVNDQTLKQLAQWLQVEHGMQVCVTTLWRTLTRLGLSLKKSRSMPPSRPVRMS
jgi:transposase